MTIASLLRPVRSLGPLFRPPFPQLWLVVLLYYAWCFIAHPHSQTLRGNFPDPDDYMYLVQLMDWMSGQGWYDNIQHRLNPPDGVMIQFSRLAMLPMAAIMYLFEQFGLGPRGAAMLMALLYPLMLLAGLFVSLKKLARHFIPIEWCGLTPFVALFSTAMMYMYQPGHVDHHGLMIIVVVMALDSGLRMIETPGDSLGGIVTGAWLALGTVLALEILPWVLLIGGYLGLWSAIKGRTAARNGLAFGLSYYLLSIFGLLLTRPPVDFFAVDLLTYSIVYVALAAGIAVAFAAAAATSSLSLAIRMPVTALIACIAGFLFLHRFPELITGPYGAMDFELQKLVLGEVVEAMPMVGRLHSVYLLTAFSGASLLALAAGIFAFWKGGKDVRWAWGFLLTLLVAAYLLTMFYQCRFGGELGMLTVIPLTLLLQKGWLRARGLGSTRTRVFAELGLLLLVGPLFSVVMPALADGRSFNTGVLLFPVTNTVDYCDMAELENVLRDPTRLGSHPRIIMNDMGLGPELLYRTQHKVLAAPFLDTMGTMDSYRFFSTMYPDEAKSIVMRRHVDLVVACKSIPLSYLRGNPMQPDSKALHDFAPHFAELLLQGAVPPWLHPIKVAGLKNFVVYEVGLGASSPATPEIAR